MGNFFFLTLVPFRDRRILENIRFYVRLGMAYILGGEELNNFLRYVTLGKQILTIWLLNDATNYL